MMKVLKRCGRCGLSYAAVVLGVTVLTICAPRSLASSSGTYAWTNFVGLPGGSGSADGTGGAARFATPMGVAVDSTGNVYVADANNQTIRKVTPAGEVTTLAGLAGNPGHDDGTGNVARFYHPMGVALDGTGNLYVADNFNHTIRKGTPAGTFWTFAGSAGSTGSTDGTGSAARFNKPGGVAVDSTGNVYVADSGNHTIRKITPSGVVTTLAGLAGSSGSVDDTGKAARFNSPAGVAVDGEGNVYVADQNNHTIRKVTSAAVVTTLAGLAGSSGSTDGTGNAARFYSPGNLLVDSDGNLFVGDSWNHTIRKVTATGVVTTVAGQSGVFGSSDGTGNAASFHNPTGVAVDSTSNIYVADAYNDAIRKVTPTGTVTTLAGCPGHPGSIDGTGTTARFRYPSGVAVGGTGTIYVADNSNHTIRQITAAGVVTTLAGSAGVSGSADGTGSAAGFYYPNGVAVDGTSNVYVADQYNHTIRKITPAGAVTTLAGLARTSGSTDGTGSTARFYRPSGVAADGTGNVYVADQYNHTIRKVTPAGAVTTLAGLARSSGSTDGTGSAARFYYPTGVAVDGAGNVYVADQYNSTIRKVTSSGTVTTLAGRAGYQGSVDGTGSAARFRQPYGVAVDSTGNVYVADYYNQTIRKVTPGGTVTTIGGYPGVASGEDGVGESARFSCPGSVAMDTAGDLYVADSNNNRISKGTPPPVITTASLLPGGTVGVAYSQSLTAGSGVAPYTWSIIAGALPLDLNLSGDGVISGTPSAAATFSFTVQAAGNNGAAATKDFSLTIDIPPPPVPSNPEPADGQIDLPVGLVLSWAGSAADSVFDLYVDTVNPPVTRLAAALTQTSFVPSLAPGTRYYWKVEARNSVGLTQGPVWTFATHVTADIDGDGAVILADLKLLVAAWNTTPASPKWNLNADLDDSGSVTLADLKILVANWNRSL